MVKKKTLKLMILSICTVFLFMQVFMYHNSFSAFAANEDFDEGSVKLKLIYEDRLPEKRINELKVDKNETVVLENVTIDRNTTINVPASSALIIRGNVKNYGQINLDGKLIIESGASLNGERITKNLDITFVKSDTIGGVKISESGLFFVSENAKHIIQNAGLIDNDGTYILEGKLVTNGVVLNNNLLEISETGSMLVNGFEKRLNEDVIIAEPNSESLYIQTMGAEIASQGLIAFYSLPGYVQSPKLVGNSYVNFYENCREICYR